MKRRSPTERIHKLEDILQQVQERNAVLEQALQQIEAAIASLREKKEDK